jgi:hypothetical protein
MDERQTTYGDSYISDCAKRGAAMMGKTRKRSGDKSRRTYRTKLEGLESRTMMSAEGNSNIPTGGSPPTYVDPPFDANLAKKLATPLATDVGGSWTARKDWPFRATHAAMLPTGKVLMWNKANQTYIWDPATGQLAQQPKTKYNLFCAGNILLGDGRLMVIGGHNGGGFIGYEYASIYDPWAKTYTRIESMNDARWYPSATIMGNGDVVTISGSIDTETVNELPQVWDASAGTWIELTDASRILPLYPRAFAAPDGRVSRFLDISGTGEWTDVDEMGYGSRVRGTAVMYDEGKMITLGGAADEQYKSTATAEVIDLNDPNPEWRFTNPMKVPRKNLNASILPTGEVLVLGGNYGKGDNDKQSPVFTVEVWNPDTEAWTTWNSTGVQFWYHSTTTLLPDGRIIAAGGNSTEDSQVFSPPYLFQGTRPTITAAPYHIDYGSNFQITSPEGANIDKVTMVRMGSATHSQNYDQRFASLDFQWNGSQLSITAPGNPNNMPPGYYMMYVIKDGVPSIAKTIKLGNVEYNDGGGYSGSGLLASENVFVATASDVEYVANILKEYGTSRILDGSNAEDYAYDYNGDGAITPGDLLIALDAMHRNAAFAEAYLSYTEGSEHDEHKSPVFATDLSAERAGATSAGAAVGFSLAAMNQFASVHTMHHASNTDVAISNTPSSSSSVVQTAISPVVAQAHEQHGGTSAESAENHDGSATGPVETHVAQDLGSGQSHAENVRSSDADSADEVKPVKLSQKWCVVKPVNKPIFVALDGQRRCGCDAKALAVQKAALAALPGKGFANGATTTSCHPSGPAISPQIADFYFGGNGQMSASDGASGDLESFFELRSTCMASRDQVLGVESSDVRWVEEARLAGFGALFASAAVLQFVGHSRKSHDREQVRRRLRLQTNPHS